MRLAITSAFCWPEVRRGGERYIQSMGAALAGRGHDVVILSSGWEPSTTELDGVTTVRFRRVARDDRLHERHFGARVLPALLAGRFDAVHSMGRHDAVASTLAAAAHPQRRTVFTDLGVPDRAWWRTQGRADLLAVGQVVRSIDVYGCMSRWALSFLERDWQRSDGVVTPGGVDLADFRPAERHPQPTLLFSGAVTEPRKGVADLLQAMAVVRRHVPDIRLQLSGPGDPSALLAGAPPGVADHVEVLRRGTPGEQARRYARAWLTVLPSTYDSFGMALVESLACGTPLVTTTEGAPPELVDEGITGTTCRAHDPADLAAAILRGLDLVCAPETVDACRETAGRFDWRTSLAPAAECLYRGDPPPPPWR